MGTLRADKRGWGSGWPNCPSSKQVTVSGGGIKLRVHRDIADIVKFGLEATVALGYNLDRDKDDWGFACRAIRGSSSPSNHSWGLAIDLNAIYNPMTSKLVTNMPPEMVQLWKALGFGWGGDYVSRPDAMHFEFLGTPADAKRIRDNLAKLGTTPPAPKNPMPKLTRTLWKRSTPGQDIVVMKVLFAAVGYIGWVGQQSAKDQQTFGWGTEAEVKRFQQNIRDFFGDKTINVDGIVGSKTWKWLEFLLVNKGVVSAK